MSYIQKEEFNKAIEHLKLDISSLRTGRATPALVEDIIVESYGARQPLKHVASISVADAKTLSIVPWDKGLMKAVEDGIRASQLGINPVNDGKVIRLPLPELTTERRQELIKVLHQKLETSRISIRKIREDMKSLIEKADEDKEIGEDEKFKQLDELERTVKEFNDKIKEIGEDKEKEINTI